MRSRSSLRLLEHGAPGKDYVVAAPVQLDDLAFEPLAQERVEVPHALMSTRPGQEAPQPDVQDQASLTTSITGPSTVRWSL